METNVGPAFHVEIGFEGPELGRGLQSVESCRFRMLPEQK